MIIPREILIDDYLGATDFHGNQLEREQILYIYNKLEDVLNSNNGYLEKEGYVYFVKDKNGLIKIGCSGDFKNRKNTLKSKYGDLKLLRLIKCNDMINLERYFHVIFRNNRVTGEWFDLKEYEVLNYNFGYLDNNFEAEDIKVG